MKKLLTILAITFALLLSACNATAPQPGNRPAESNNTTANSNSDVPAEQRLVEVTIPHYKTGDNVGSLVFLPQVERFNQQYEGRFKINVEEITQDLYIDKIKQLGAQRMLPVLIEGGIDKVWFEEVIIAGGLYYDLKPFFDSKPDLRNLLNKDNYEYNIRDGELVTVTLPMVNTITMFYNEALWTPSRPIRDMSWREVAEDLNGEKIAFMTSENTWTTMLALTALVASEPGGRRTADWQHRR